MKFFFKLTLIICLFILATAKAATTTINNIPSVFDAGVTQKRFQTELPMVPKPEKPAIKREEPAAGPIANAEKIRFKLTRVIIEGNTAIPSSELEKIVQPSLNKMISLADLQELAHAVTVKYRESGYILSQAILPPQTIQNGVVRMQVVEGFINQITISGNPGLAKITLENYSQPIKQSHPLKIKVLEKQMLLMDDLPGITEQAVITPSKNTPGGADLTLLTTRKSIDGYASYDNYGTRYLGPLELGAAATLNSAFFPGDSNLFHIAGTTQNDSMRFEEFVHTQPIGCNGMRYTLGTTYSATNPKFTLTDFNIQGISSLIYLDFSYPFLRSRSENFSLHSTFSWQNVTSTILDAPFYQDRLRFLTVGGSYDHIDHLHGINSVSVNLEHGFNILGANDHFEQSRPKGISNYTKISPYISRLQLISERFSFLAALQGQYAMNPLLATPQYPFGGPDFGRGYDPAEIIGDSGLGGKLELRMNTSPALKFLQTVQYYIFYDGGEIWNRDTTNFPPKQSAFSTGVGARFSFLPEIQGNFFIAKPLTRPVATIKAMDQNANQLRSFFQIVANF